MSLHKISWKPLLLFFIAFHATPALKAQIWEVGVSGGAAFYMGDIGYDPANALKLFRPNLGGFVRYHQGIKFGVRGQIMGINLYGDEPQFRRNASGRQPGHKFTARMVEVGVLPEWRPFYIGAVEFYVFSGLNVVLSSTKTTFVGTSPADGIARDQAQSFPQAFVSMPFGGGLQWFVNEGNALSVELSNRYVFSDYIDGVSYAANPKTKDMYLTMNVVYSVFFGRNYQRYSKYDKSFYHRGYREGKIYCPKF